MKMKKIISAILALALVVTTTFCVSFSASAATSGNCGAVGSKVNWSYNAASKTLSLTGTGTIKNYGVTGINKVPWYDYREEITTINVGEGITALGQACFFYCINLTSVTLPSTLQTIAGNEANYGSFRECKALKTIKLPNGLKTIGAMAFRDCTSLTSITFPDSLTSLGIAAFQGCTSLATVTYGNGLTDTGFEAFRECGVTTVNFSPTITTISGYSFFATRIKEIEIPEAITAIGIRAFANCTFITKATVYNANCEYQGIIGEDPFNGSNQTLTMRGHSASTTQTYAEEKGYKFESIDPCDHSVTHEVVTIPATCTTPGETTQVCDACGFVVSTTAVKELGHKYVLINELDETVENGHIYRDFKCSVCNDEYTEIKHEADVEGFYEYANTATCTTPGMETYTCTVQNCGHVTRKVANKGNHKVEEYTVTAEPTCTAEGSRTGVCTECNASVTEAINPLGHTNEFVENLDNVADDGHTYEIYQCTVCEEQTLVPTHVEWVDGNYTSTVISNPTCTIDGVRSDKCDICSQRRTVALPANGEHDWYETTRNEPTCTAKGQIFYACHNCTLTKKENTDALGHDFVIQEDKCVAPTCTTAGYDFYKCSRCTQSENRTVNALGHSPTEDSYTVLVEPTCETAGKASGVCATCGEDMPNIVLDALGHEYEDVTVPIDDKPGHSLLTPTCTRCNSTEPSTTVHDEWIAEYTTTEVIAEGDCVVARTTTDTCTLCNKKKTNTIPAPGHKYAFTGMDETGELNYLCSTCNEALKRTPTSVLLIWSARNVNKEPSTVINGYLFEVVSDGVINAKDYAMLTKAKAIYQKYQDEKPQVTVPQL